MKKSLIVSSLFLISNLIFSHGKSSSEADYHFNQNKGQFVESVKYHSQIHVGDIFFEKNTFTFDLFSSEDLEMLDKIRHDRNYREKYGKKAYNFKLRKSAFRMNFLGANTEVDIRATELRDGVKNYLKGNNSNKWGIGVQSFYHLTYKDMYDGIDVQVYSKGDDLKYDFIVSEGSNPSIIKINYEGVEKIEVGAAGNLNITLPNTSLKELAPIAYQSINGKKVMVECKFVLKGTELSFEFPNGYDTSKELVIDPTWVFSTFTGSTGDNWGFTATYDEDGNFYGGGISLASGFPVSTGAYDVTFGGAIDASIIKYDPTGANRIYATYIGGSNADQPHSLVTNLNGELVIMGATSSTNFPTSPGAYDATHNGGSSVTPNSETFSNGADIFVTKLNAAGNGIIGSTYLGGSENDGLALNGTLQHNYSDENRGEVVLDDNDNIYIVSTSESGDYPVTSGAHQTTSAGDFDAVVTKLTPTLDDVTWSTYVGGSGGEAGYSIRVNETNNTIVVCGGTTSNDIGATSGVINPSYKGGSSDGFICVLNDNNGSLNAMTYIGTNNYDQTYITEVDQFGYIYVTGQTKGNYPVVNAPYSVAGSAQFIHKLSSDLQNTEYSTLFGDGARSSIDISITAFLVDNCGNVYVSGWGGSTNNEGSTNNLPITGDAIDATTDGSDFYFIVIARDAQNLLYGTYFGGSGDEHVDGGTSRFDKRGTIYQGVCAGCGGSNAFPTTPGSWSTTNGSSNCNFGAIKIGLDFQGIVANADDPGDVLLCGAPFNVDFSAGSTPPPNTYWDFGDGNTLGIGSDNNPTHTYADTGTYNVMYVAIDSASCNIADTAYFDVTVINNGTLDAQINIPPYDPCQDSLTVTLEFTGSGADSLYWDMGNGDSFINDTLVNYTYTSNGDYIITFEAYDFACGGFNTVRDTIRFNPIYTAVQANSPGDQEYCGAPFNVDFTAGATPPPNNYWDFGDGSGNSTLPDVTYTYSDTGSYTVMYVAIDSNTCNIADTAYFDITLTPAEQLDAQFTIPPYNNCQDSLTVDFEFTGTGADSLYWSMGDGTTYINDTLFSHTFTTNGDYIIVFEAFDLQCNNSVSLTDTVHFNPSYTTVQANSPGDQVLCAQPYNVDFTAGATPPPNNYWDFGDGSGNSSLPDVTYTYADTGVYTVMFVAIDSSTCNIADTAYFDVQLIKPEALDAQFNIPSYDPCQDSLTINLQFTGTGADSLYWDMGDGTTFINDLTINHTYTNSGEFIVVFEAYDMQCNNTEIFTDTVRFNPIKTEVTTNVDPAVDICGSNLAIDFSSGNPAPPQNYWDFGDGNTSTQIDPTHIYASSGTYNGFFVAIDSSTCNIADTMYFPITINLIPELDVNFDYVPPVPCAVENYEIDLKAAAVGADSIYWNMGDGTEFFNDTVINYEYAMPGTYPITVVLFKDGCAPKVFNSQAEFIEIKETTGIIPNVFTPNGDNWNDELEFIGVDGTQDYSVKIFDRWGRKVFESTDASDNWDGGGHAEGTYFYELRYTDVCSSEEKLVTGYVTLLRGPKK